jgi:DNA-directed RNA polymerase specialized sigma24 family protein
MIRRKRKNEVLRSFRDLGTDDAVLVDTIPDIRPSPELACSQNESSAFLDALLNKIKPRFREAVRMAYYDELSAPEASSALGIPVTTYKARLLRGRLLLQAEARRQVSRVITMT